ncbi:DUF1702 family protein [Saccharothrix hoggarensis]|uniref:DUF1702 family protein n=1 Tax=Saccharothrix hoggarensis TaxID=913853 RepID=A0ABW3R3Y0_9PSEU
MSNGWRSLRRRILTPSVSETSLVKRGFPRKDAASQELLETVGEKFLTGYANAVEARSPAQAEEWLETIPARFRGFAYEGAGMGYAMLDGLPGGGRRHVADFLAGPAEKHTYIVYVGIGWAMARLPRFRWPSPDGLDPLLRWLVLDGYGFHQAYFRTEKYVRRQYREPAFPWPGGRYSEYAQRGIDQGIGRALWFVCGTDVDLVASTIAGFPEHRRSDLYAGVGLASTYACGATDDELAELVRLAGPHRGPLAQGSAFAAEARVRAGLLIPETDRATRAICGLPAERAAAITQEVRPAVPVDGVVPAFESWRQRIADEVLTSGGVAP